LRNTLLNIGLSTIRLNLTEVSYFELSCHLFIAHGNIFKYTSTCPDGKTHNQIDHNLIDRRWHSRIFDVDLSGELTVILITI